MLTVLRTIWGCRRGRGTYEARSQQHTANAHCADEDAHGERDGKQSQHAHVAAWSTLGGGRPCITR